MRWSGGVALAVVFGFGVVVGAGVPAAKPKVTNLLQTELSADFTPGREILVDLVEVPPNAVLERHWHPGEEFQYYLEGDAMVDIEGQGTITGKPGTVGHIPYKKHHTARAGARGAKVIVFRVHTKGEPWRYAVEPGAK